jgi:hypothetical protein
MALEQHCTLLVHLKDVKTAATQMEEITQNLEGNDDDLKCQALKTAILLLLNGEDVVRGSAPSSRTPTHVPLSRRPTAIRGGGGRSRRGGAPSRGRLRAFFRARCAPPPLPILAPSHARGQASRWKNNVD